MTSRPAALLPVVLVSRWEGYCLPCGSDERLLALTWTGHRGLRAWLAGRSWNDGQLRLTCTACGGVDPVGWEVEAEQEPEVVEELATPAFDPTLFGPVAQETAVDADEVLPGLTPDVVPGLAPDVETVVLPVQDAPTWQPVAAWQDEVLADAPPVQATPVVQASASAQATAPEQVAVPVLAAAVEDLVPTPRDAVLPAVSLAPEPAPEPAPTSFALRAAALLAAAAASSEPHVAPAEAVEQFRGPVLDLPALEPPSVGLPGTDRPALEPAGVEAAAVEAAPADLPAVAWPDADVLTPEPTVHADDVAVPLLAPWAAAGQPETVVEPVREPLALEPLALEPLALEPLALEPLALEPLPVEPPALVAAPAAPVSLQKAVPLADAPPLVRPVSLAKPVSLVKRVPAAPAPVEAGPTEAAPVDAVPDVPVEDVPVRPVRCVVRVVQVLELDAPSPLSLRAVSESGLATPLIPVVPAQAGPPRIEQLPEEPLPAPRKGRRWARQFDLAG